MATRHVLVVDDQEIVRTLIARILRDGGYDVLEATNGATALELLGEREPAYFDLIVTDSMLVGMDGYTFALRVRSSHPAMRMLHVTGNPSSQNVQRFRALGVPTLAKPFGPEALLEEVERLLA